MTSSIVGSGGSITQILTGNITWSHPEFSFQAWNSSGNNPPSALLFACTSNNATIVETCCEDNSLPTTLLDRSGDATNDTVGEDGYINWCKIFHTEMPDEGLNITQQPAALESSNWERCFNQVADPARNTFGSAVNLTTESNVWLCQLAGNAATTTYGSVSETTGAAPRTLTVSGLAVLAVAILPVIVLTTLA